MPNQDSVTAQGGPYGVPVGIDVDQVVQRYRVLEVEYDNLREHRDRLWRERDELQAEVKRLRGVRLREAYEALRREDDRA